MSHKPRAVDLKLLLKLAVLEKITDNEYIPKFKHQNIISVDHR